MIVLIMKYYFVKKLISYCYLICKGFFTIEEMLK